MPVRPPLFVTLTGADEATDIARMADLSARYPVEWGLLFTPIHQGAGRFPSFDFVAKLIERGAMRFSRRTRAGSSCARRVRGVGGPARGKLRSRPDQHVRTRRAARPCASLRRCDGRGDFPADARVDWLFDKSGGRGAAPPSWPKAREGAFCGYAGGLNPDNIGVALPAIAACVPEGQPYWIDMESGVRTDDRFDLDKCELVLTQVFDAG